MREIADISMFESLAHSSGSSSMNSLSVFNYSGNPIINAATHNMVCVRNAEVEPELRSIPSAAVRSGLSSVGGVGATALGGLGGLIGSQTSFSGLPDMLRRIVAQDPETLNGLLSGVIQSGMPNPAMVSSALGVGLPVNTLLAHGLITRKDGFSRRGSWRRTLASLLGQLGGGGLGLLGGYGLGVLNPLFTPLIFGLGSSLGGAIGHRYSSHSNYLRALRECERVSATAGIKRFGSDHYLVRKIRDIDAIRNAFRLGRISRRQMESAVSRSWFDNDFFVPGNIVSSESISGNNNM